MTLSFDISEFLPNVKLETFTTRIDTVFGATFVVLAPEHPLAKKIIQPGYEKEVNKYIENASKQTEIDRTSTDRLKTGVKTGAYCINPLNNERIPVFIGDYVLSTYGTGVVMGVPAHDQRDFEFAKKYDLEIRVVVSPENWDGEELLKAWTLEGLQVNSAEFNGISNVDAKNLISDKVEKNNWGYKTVTYHLRDWLVSRQRYWGTPIPIVYLSLIHI